MELSSKIILGLERLSEVFKKLLWEKAKIHGISPIQIQILLFVSGHDIELCNVSYLAKDFNVTKPTISDAVRVLIKKELLAKDFSPSDNRRYNLELTSKGQLIIADLSAYASPISSEIDAIDMPDLQVLYNSITKVIYQLNQKGIIEVQRNCFTCRHYSGNRKDVHHCNFLQQELKSEDIRLDCGGFEVVG